MTKDQSTEQKILQAAKEVFQEQGMAGARMQDIADRAGINKALLHYYFRNKEKLFEVIFAEAATKFVPKVSILFASDLELFEKIRQFTSSYIDIMLENPYLPIFVLSEMNKNDSADFIEKFWPGKGLAVGKFVNQVNEEIALGNIKPISPIQLVINLVSMCIFPFAARPMVRMVWGVSDAQFLQLMEERKTFVANFVIDSIRK